MIFLVSALVGAAAGYLGSFMVLKRMSLVGDALSHVALPGLAIALALQISPFIGAFVALTIAVFGIWYLQEKTTLYTESLVGIFFTASLAVGILVTPEPELLEALFGNIQKLGLTESLIAIFLSVIVIFITRIISKKLLLGVISEELALSLQTKTKLINLVYLILVGTIVALGVKFVGTLLTGALVIVPAAAAKNWSRSLNQYTLLSALFGLCSSVFGILFSEFLHFPPGPIVVLTGVFLFLITTGYKLNK
jgi:ABC-type Mn2+/Zn2+ transport system permease subunit